MDLVIKKNVPASVCVGKEQLCPRISPSGTETSSLAHVSLCFGSIHPAAVLELYPNAVNHTSSEPRTHIRETTSYRLQTKQGLPFFVVFVLFFFYTACSLDPKLETHSA